jgi:MFS family permease
MSTYTSKEEETMKLTPANLLAVAKDPGTWLYIIGCFSIYSFQVSLSYFTPYFTAVLGVSVTFTGFIAVFRQYGLRIISSPIGGWLGDKLGSTGKVIRGSMAILGVLVLVVLFLPEGAPLALLVAIVFILGLLGTMNISLQASISKDCMLPPKHMGIVVGATALFSADLFQQTLFGSWLDVYGDALGYDYIWIFTLCNIALCIIVLSIAIARRKRAEAKLAVENTNAANEKAIEGAQ